MKIWLDDEPDKPTRTPPPNFQAVVTAREAIRLLKTGSVTEINFDHDLGGFFDGGTVAKWIEWKAFLGQIPRLKWGIHSANPAGRARIEAAMQSAERFWG